MSCVFLSNNPRQNYGSGNLSTFIPNLGLLQIIQVGISPKKYNLSVLTPKNHGICCTEYMNILATVQQKKGTENGRNFYIFSDL